MLKIARKYSQNGKGSIKGIIVFQFKLVTCDDGNFEESKVIPNSSWSTKYLFQSVSSE